MKYNELTEDEIAIIDHKGTEAPFVNEYDSFFQEGTYICKKCNNPLFTSKSKFDSGCGWPSFEEHFPNSVKRSVDMDGRRTEITCSNCGAHLGHVFEGEKLTIKDTRHCVNSLSIKFIKKDEDLPAIILELETATFAGGCFWCTEAVFQNLKGVESVTPGYCGGSKVNPTYEQVVTGTTGHAESIQIVFKPNEISYEVLLDIFFHTHNPTTLNRQGNDVGTQYRSEIFFHSDTQRIIAESVIEKIGDEFDSPIVTVVSEFVSFYPAEDYHKNYYITHKNQMYCNLVISPKLNKLVEKYSKFLKN